MSKPEVVEAARSGESLSADDLAYLAQRDGVAGVDLRTLADPEELRQMVAPKGQLVAEQANTGTTLILTQEELETIQEGRAAAEKAEPKAFRKQTREAVDAVASTTTEERQRQRQQAIKEMERAQAGPDDEDDEDESYDQWTNDELRGEIVRRNEGREEVDQLPLSGKKADLIAVLEADDEGSEEQEG